MSVNVLSLSVYRGRHIIVTKRFWIGLHTELHRCQSGPIASTNPNGAKPRSSLSCVYAEKIRHGVKTRWGKDKIAVVLRRDHGQTISASTVASTVGRILKTLFTKGIITKSRSAPRARKKRNFRNTHARRWVYKAYKLMKMGERVQIYHMTVTKNGITVKHFQAWERKSKFIHAQVYSHAKASSAKRFLGELIDKTPFTIKSIQVDGGSEFMAEFEQACEDVNIPLIVLPPSRPTYNGGVERGNRTFKEEFYYKRDLLADGIGVMRFELRKAVEKYSTYRPHHALAGLTPMAYIQNTQKGE